MSESDASEDDKVSKVKTYSVESNSCVWRPKFDKWKGKHAVLILQSAGQADLPEDAIPEAQDSDSEPDDDCDDQAEGYLSGCGFNATFVQNFYISRGVAQEDITTVNFSVNAGRKDPAAVIQAFLQKHSKTTNNNKRHTIIYYCGHGDASGKWCFHLHGQKHGGKQDVRVSKSDMENW